jgi:uncharacterized spore protein YtfJ
MPNVDEMLEGARDAMNVRRVFGDAYEEGGVTVIPVASVRGGGGGGGDSDNNGGGGFGLQTRPIGAYVISGGDVRWRPAVDPNRIVLGWQIVSVLALFVGWRVARLFRT